MKKHSLICVLLAFISPNCFAGIDPFSMSLEELMEIPVSVSSRKALSQRETPGIVTVITAEEIRNSGARGLIDALRLVPGIHFRAMVYNGIGLGMRGMMGAEGRVLLLIDGVEFNEQRYGSTIFGQGFPIEQVARIEIIRGSAMALYGGAAELGVINIITHNAATLDGIRASASLAYASESERKSGDKFSLMMGQKRDNFAWTAQLHASHGMRSDRSYTDMMGKSVNLENTNDVALSNVNIGLEIGDFQARYIHDEPRFKSSTGAGLVRASPESITFLSNSLLLQHNFKPNEQWTVNPSLLLQEQNPRKIVGGRSNLIAGTSVERWAAKLPVTWNYTDNLYLAAGLEYSHNKFDPLLRGGSTRLGSMPYESNDVFSQYFEALWNNPWGNLTGSVRFDDNDYAGEQRSARLGYTKQWDQWHIKLNRSIATSAPWLENFATNKRSKPEGSRSFEIEAGYQFSPDEQLTVNLFQVSTSDTLILTNNGAVESKGIETSYRTRKKWGYVDLGYSYYQAGKTDTKNFQIFDWEQGGIMVDDKAHVGFPQHKLTASAHWELSPTVSINPSLIHWGSYWAYDMPTTSPTSPISAQGLHKQAAATLLNVNLRWEQAVKNLDLSLGGYNLLNQKINFAQPYPGGHNLLPDMSREFVLKAEYKFD